MLFLIAAHFVAALALLPASRRLGRRIFLVAAGVPAITAVWALAALLSENGGAPARVAYPWIAALNADLSFEAAGLSALMALLIGTIGALVFVYSYFYFSPEDPSHGRVCALLLAFTGSMLGLVLADGFFTLFLFWEATSVTSFFLIGTNYGQPPARAAATQALLITGVGGIAMLVGLTLFGSSTGIWHLSAMNAVAGIGGTGLPAAALILVMLGCLAKSAQVPFNSWLPAAMAAPTPISAFLHSATMVKAGVYLIARLSPHLGAGPWRTLVLVSASFSILLAGWRALRQDDLKLLLAHSTVAQLGLMCLLFAIPDARAWIGAVVLLVAHAMAKAGLFMGVGIIDRVAKTREISRLDRLGRSLRPLAAIMGVGFAALAGVPLTLAFLAKEEGLEGLLHFDSSATALLIGVVATGALLTAAYSTYAFVGAFLAPARSEAAEVIHPPSRWFQFPAAVLAAGGIVLGVVVFAAEKIVGPAVASATGLRAGEWHLPIIPKAGPMLAVSSAALGLGLVLGLRDRERRFLLRASLPYTMGQRGYEAINVGLIRLADRLAGVVQSGSLPLYIATIAIAGLGFVVWALGGISISTDVLPPAGSLTEGLLVTACAGLAIAVALQRRRVVAVLLLGGVGYGLAGLFIVFGAPDLALTQIAVETLVVVVFLLVIGRQPPEFERAKFVSSEIPKIAVALFAGVAIFALLVGSSGYQAEHFVSAEIMSRSVEEAGAKNVVNAILVDFRALDTLGEITVLAIAAIGAATLVGHELVRKRRA